MTKQINVDPSCYDLAKGWLEDEITEFEDKDVLSLAEVVQNAVEDWFEEKGWAEK
jgi:hypothetical protein